jgi:hypothetical protein
MGAKPFSNVLTDKKLAKTKKKVNNLSLRYYPADSNGIISAFYSTHDGYLIFVILL